MLAAGGGLVCAWRWRDERYRIPVVLFVAWLLLYFGRPTWGALLNLLPLSHDLQLHLFIAGVHLGGIFLIGLGLAAPWEWAWSRAHSGRNAHYLVVPAALTGLLLFPVYQERLAYLAQNAAWMVETQTAVAVEEKDLSSTISSMSAA